MKVLRAAADTIRERLQRGGEVEPGPISCELETIEKHGGEMTMTCPHCGSEIAEGSQFCSSCGKKPGAGPAAQASTKKKMGWKMKVLIGFAGLVLLGGIGGIGDLMDPTAELRRHSREATKLHGEALGDIAEAMQRLGEWTAGRADEANRKPDLELLSHQGMRGLGEYGNASIIGTVKNNSSRQYSYVQITFELLDADGNTIGTALANIAGLRPGATWKYKAGVMHDDIAEYRLQKITGY